MDGDVKFSPESILLLREELLRDPSLGGTAARIAPISENGFNPLVWYQKFEYASAHWLLKPAAQIFGTVDIAPGAFSMVRVNSLLYGIEEHVSNLFQYLFILL